MTLLKRLRNGDAIPSVFDDLFSRSLFDWGRLNYSNTGTTLPAVNIKETKEDFEVEMVAPGMNKKDFKIELDGNLLTISSEKQQQNEENEEQKFTLREFSYQSFQRSFTLPKDVVEYDKIEARYEEGVLKLVIPKKEEARVKPPRQIEIT